MNKHNSSNTSAAIRKLVLTAIRKHCKNDATLTGLALKMKNLKKFITAKRNSCNIDMTDDNALNMLIKANNDKGEIIIAQALKEYDELTLKYSKLVKDYVSECVANDDTIKTFFSYDPETCPITFMRLICCRDYLLAKMTSLAFFLWYNFCNSN